MVAIRQSPEGMFTRVLGRSRESKSCRHFVQRESVLDCEQSRQIPSAPVPAHKSNLIEFTREEWEARRRRKMFRLISAYIERLRSHCIFAYSALASFRM